MLEKRRYTITGILGTIAFHLILLVLFLTAKLGEVKTKHEELIDIEFSEEEYKPIEEIINETEPDQEAINPLSQEVLNNIASNVADKVNEAVSTDKYIEEVMKELGMEEINPQYDNSLPEDIVSERKEPKKKEVKTNFGLTRITYNVPPNRKARHIDRPIYRCQGGGTVVVDISVTPTGEVIQAAIKSSSTNETCLTEAALASARNCYFERDNAAEKRVNGTITYIFVAQ
jgi:TonB family protein